MKKTGRFLFDWDWVEILFSDKDLLYDVWSVLNAIRVGEQIPQNLSPIAMAVVNMMINKITESSDNYEKKCSKNRENAQKRWGTKKKTTDEPKAEQDTTPQKEIKQNIDALNDYDNAPLISNEEERRDYLDMTDEEREEYERQIEMKWAKLEADGYQIPDYYEVADFVKKEFLTVDHSSFWTECNEKIWQENGRYIDWKEKCRNLSRLNKEEDERWMKEREKKEKEERIKQDAFEYLTRMHAGGPRTLTSELRAYFEQNGIAYR